MPLGTRAWQLRHNAEAARGVPSNTGWWILAQCLTASGSADPHDPYGVTTQPAVAAGSGDDVRILLASATSRRHGSSMTENLQQFVDDYVAVWASREPDVMARMWHRDGVLHHPVLSHDIGGEVVPYNNDNTKASIPGFEWRLRSWAAVGERMFLEWTCQGEIGGKAMSWSGVDVMARGGWEDPRGDRVSGHLPAPTGPGPVAARFGPRRR